MNNYDPQQYRLSKAHRSTFEELTRDQLEWRDEAECVSEDTELFFVDETESTAERRFRERVAKGICDGCKVSNQCLEEAITTDERFGIRGGLNPDERYALSGRVVPYSKNRHR